MTGVGSFEVVGFGVDDMTLGFDMTGSKSIRRLNSMPGIDTRWGKRLGERGSWGAWANAFGRSAAHWKPETCRLYVQGKLSADGTLCAPGEFRQACHALFQRMALVGVTSYEPVWVTRLDVAVDAHCKPAAGKLLLDALEAARGRLRWRRSLRTRRSAPLAAHSQRVPADGTPHERTSAWASAAIVGRVGFWVWPGETLGTGLKIAREKRRREVAMEKLTDPKMSLTEMSRKSGVFATIEHANGSSVTNVRHIPYVEKYQHSNAVLETPAQRIQRVAVEEARTRADERS